jgi:hypothetical protein
MQTTLTVIKARKTGNPIANRTRNEPIINTNHIHHSIDVLLYEGSLSAFLNVKLLKWSENCLANSITSKRYPKEMKDRKIHLGRAYVFTTLTPSHNS